MSGILMLSRGRMSNVAVSGSRLLYNPWPSAKPRITALARPPV